MAAFPTEIVAYALQWLIAGIFLQAGVSKLQTENQHYYANAIEAYGMTPKSLTQILPGLIGGFEVLICLLILLPAATKLGLIVAAGLFGVYLAAFAKQILQGKADMNCGCAGPGADVKISPLLLVRNAVLTLLCLFAVSSAAVPLGFEWFLVLPMAGIFALIYFSSDQLIANQQKIQLLENT